MYRIARHRTIKEENIDTPCLMHDSSSLEDDGKVLRNVFQNCPLRESIRKVIARWRAIASIVDRLFSAGNRAEEEF